MDYFSIPRKAKFARTPTPSVGIAFVVMFFLCFGSYDMAWLPLCQLYTAEILPFSIRSKAFSVGSFVTALCLSISNFVNPIGLEMLQVSFTLPVPLSHDRSIADPFGIVEILFRVPDSSSHIPGLYLVVLH